MLAKLRRIAWWESTSVDQERDVDHRNVQASWECSRPLKSSVVNTDSWKLISSKRRMTVDRGWRWKAREFVLWEDWLSLWARQYSTLVSSMWAKSRVEILTRYDIIFSRVSGWSVDNWRCEGCDRAIIPEWVGRRWCIHWVAKHRERFNSITVKEFHRWKSQCG